MITFWFFPACQRQPLPMLIHDCCLNPRQLLGGFPRVYSQWKIHIRFALKIMDASSLNMHLRFAWIYLLNDYSPTVCITNADMYNVIQYWWALLSNSTKSPILIDFSFKVYRSKYFNIFPPWVDKCSYKSSIFIEKGPNHTANNDKNQFIGVTLCDICRL